MKRFFAALAVLFFALAAPAHAQFGKNIKVLVVFTPSGSAYVATRGVTKQSWTDSSIARLTTALSNSLITHTVSKATGGAYSTGFYYLDCCAGKISTAPFAINQALGDTGIAGARDDSGADAVIVVTDVNDAGTDSVPEKCASPTKAMIVINARTETSSEPNVLERAFGRMMCAGTYAEAGNNRSSSWDDLIATLATCKVWQDLMRTPSDTLPTHTFISMSWVIPEGGLTYGGVMITGTGPTAAASVGDVASKCGLANQTSYPFNQYTCTAGGCAAQTGGPTTFNAACQHNRTTTPAGGTATTLQVTTTSVGTATVTTCTNPPTISPQYSNPNKDGLFTPGVKSGLTTRNNAASMEAMGNLLGEYHTIKIRPMLIEGQKGKKKG